MSRTPLAVADAVGDRDAFAREGIPQYLDGPNIFAGHLSLAEVTGKAGWLPPAEEIDPESLRHVWVHFHRHREDCTAPDDDLDGEDCGCGPERSGAAFFYREVPPTTPGAVAITIAETRFRRAALTDLRDPRPVRAHRRDSSGLDHYVDTPGEYVGEHLAITPSEWTPGDTHTLGWVITHVPSGLLLVTESTPDIALQRDRARRLAALPVDWSAETTTLARDTELAHQVKQIVADVHALRADLP